jgi:drug/metabolite transporter (DMT)-like permease
MWFSLSLITIIAWAGSDLFSKKGTRPDDRYSHLRLVIVVGTAMGIHAILYLLFTGMEYSPFSIIRYFPVSAMYILSMALGYAGLRYIELSVSSPICNSSGAVTAILCFFILRQTMEPLQVVGVVLICLGIVLLSVLEKRKADMDGIRTEDDPYRKYRVGAVAIIFPLLYCVIDGLGSFMDAWYLENLMSEDEANISYELTFAACALISYLYLRVLKKQEFSYLKERDFCFGALCETAGQFTYIYAMSDNAIVAAPLISSYSIFSVLMSRIFLKEKLTKPQYFVIAMVMAGIVILGIFDA